MITYTIIHIKVGAEDYWKEVKGSVSNDKKTLHFITTTGIKTFEPIKSVIEINQNPNHPLSHIAEKLGATIYGGYEDEKDFYIVLPTYKDFMVGNYGYKHGLGKGIFCFGEYRWENSDLDGYVESNEEDKPVFYGFHWLRSRGGDLDRLPSPQYNDFKVEGNIFKDYAETGKIKDDLMIFIV